MNTSGTFVITRSITNFTWLSRIISTLAVEVFLFSPFFLSALRVSSSKKLASLRLVLRFEVYDGALSA